MKKSPLQLIRYFVPEIVCRANKDFDSEKDAEYSAEQFVVKADVVPPGSEAAEGSDQWSVEMTIHQQIGPEQNFPYEFKLNIVGFFTCSDELPKGVSKDTFVKVNGCSILYGVSREMIRATTARGPWLDLMVPTVSFYEPPLIKKAEKEEVETASPKTPAETKSVAASDLAQASVTRKRRKTHS